MRNRAGPITLVFVLASTMMCGIALGESPWPMFQHDAQHTGRSPFAGPNTLDDPETQIQILIEGEGDSDYFGTPVISSNGTLYLRARITRASETKEGLWAFTCGASQKWCYQVSGTSGMPALCEPRNVIYILSHSEGVSAIDIESGILKWKKSLNILSGHPVIGSNGRLYFLSSDPNGPCLIALNDTGEIIWTYTIGPGSVTDPAIDKEGTIYFGKGNTLFAINADGTKKWEKSFEGGSVGSPAIADDGTICVIGGGVYSEKAGWYLPCFQAIDPNNPDGEIWRACSAFYGGLPVISSAGNSYIFRTYSSWGSWKTQICGFDSEGNSWSSEGYYDYGTTKTLIVDSTETIYALFAGFFGDTIKAFSRQGELKWSFSFGRSGREGPPSLGGHGTLYVGGKKKLYAIGLARGPKPPAQIVVFDWDKDVPFGVVSLGIAVGLPYGIGSMPHAIDIPEEFREEILKRVQQIFLDSCIHNVVISDNPAEYEKATVVYFTDERDDMPAGKARIDRFNKRRDDAAVVFLPVYRPLYPTPETCAPIAETVAHEVGHTLGLRHVDPDASKDPDNLEVMDNALDVPDRPRFINALSDISDPMGLYMSPYNHNPVYHLKRYVDGVPHDELVAHGVYQGRWDMRPLELIRTVLDFGASNRVLYDVALAAGGDLDDSMTAFAYFDQITLSELSGLEFTVENGDLLQLVASSTAGGDLDTILAIGGPYDPNNLLVQPIDGQINAYLQMQSGPPPEYTTITEVIVSGTIFESKLCNSDFDRDGDVDLDDLDRLAFHWLEQDCGHLNLWCEGTDLNYNGGIDFLDYTIFAQNWLWETIRGDFDIDGDVDFEDFAIFSLAWLTVEGQGEYNPVCDISVPADGHIDWRDLDVLAGNWLAGL